MVYICYWYSESDLYTEELETKLLMYTIIQLMVTEIWTVILGQVLFLVTENFAYQNHAKRGLYNILDN